VDVIIQLRRDVDGTRRISEIAVLSSRGRDHFILTTATRFRAEPLGADRIVRGWYEHHPVPREFAERLYLAGEHVPAAYGIGETELELASREAK
jgi:pilus assembly protein CpaF